VAHPRAVLRAYFRAHAIPLPSELAPAPPALALVAGLTFVPSGPPWRSCCPGWRCGSPTTPGRPASTPPPWGRRTPPSSTPTPWAAPPPWRPRPSTCAAPARPCGWPPCPTEDDGHFSAWTLAGCGHLAHRPLNVAAVAAFLAGGGAVSEAAPGVTLHLGDCRDILPRLAPASVDAVVTDPPFGVGFRYATHDDDPAGYADFVWPAVELAESRCKPGSPVFVWQAAKHARHFAAWFPRPWRLFVAAKNFAQVLPGPMWPSYEPVLVWWTPGAEPYADGCRRDFCLADTTPGGRKRRGEVVRGHPCPRPIEHLEYVVSRWVRPGGLVLDPFAGSGTTAVACLRTGRRFVGCEVCPEYWAVARDRIAAEAAKLGLFQPAGAG
jgi:predicted RNA methylase